MVSFTFCTVKFLFFGVNLMGDGAGLSQIIGKFAY